jgi:hypothetical protein
LENFSQRWLPHFLSAAQKIIDVEASTKMPRILHELQENNFERIAAGDESWFPCSNIPIHPQQYWHDRRHMSFQ